MNGERQLEVRPGDTVFVSIDITGESTMCYTRGGHLSVMLEAFERFLKAEGFSFDGHLDFVNNEDESQWAVDVRNLLDEITDPEVYGLLFVGQAGREVVERAARLRDE